jgi:hypothetical protein
MQNILCTEKYEPVTDLYSLYLKNWSYKQVESLANYKSLSFVS